MDLTCLDGWMDGRQVGTVMKLNVQTKEQDAWTCQPHEFIGEINFVAKKDGKVGGGREGHKQRGHVLFVPYVATVFRAYGMQCALTILPVVCVVCCRRRTTAT